jgi:hypothetical protein
MQIKFENELNDLVAFNQYHFHNSRSMQTWYRIGFILGPVFGIAYALLLYRWSLSARIAVVLGVSIVFAALNWTYYRWWVAYSVRKLLGEGKNKGLIGDHAITITEEGLRETTQVSESRSTWTGIERIVENEEYVFIYISAYQAHVIPKRAFASEKDSKKFIEQARLYHSGSECLTVQPEPRKESC